MSKIDLYRQNYRVSQPNKIFGSEIRIFLPRSTFRWWSKKPEFRFKNTLIATILFFGQKIQIFGHELWISATKIAVLVWNSDFRVWCFDESEKLHFGVILNDSFFKNLPWNEYSIAFYFKSVIVYFRFFVREINSKMTKPYCSNFLIFFHILLLNIQFLRSHNYFENPLFWSKFQFRQNQC